MPFSQHSADHDMETHLIELLDELSHVQDEMLDVLAAKRDRMAENDLAGMTELQPRVEQLCQRLQACHERRGQLLQNATRQGHRVESLGDLATALPTPRKRQLAGQVQDVAARMRLVQLQTLTNWVLAQRSLLHVSQLLEIIATGGRLQPTYGTGNASAPQGTLVDQEA